MAETTSAPSLRELSEAATDGPWYTVDTPWGEGDWIVAGNPDPHAGEFVCLFDGSVIGVEEAGKAAENAAFVARLETDYRAGRLIDPTTQSEAVASARAEGWRPIETAPKNFTSVIVAVPSIHDGEPMIVGEAYFDFEHDGGAWWWSGTSHRNGYDSSIHEVNAGPPTHWMPLPAPPTTPGGRTDG